MMNPNEVAWMIKTIEITNFNDLHDCIEQYRGEKQWVFRGHRNDEWKLMPKAGRPEFAGVDDEVVFKAWMRQAIEYLPNRPQSDWEWLAIAQHHGLATRLLDWTSNPLNAAFFATRKKHSSYSVIYAAKFCKYVDTQKTNPMNVTSVAVFRPHRVVPRITRQGGLFTIHPDPKVELKDGIEGLMELHKMVISAKYRNKLHSELSYYGINAASLFPDLDGLSDYLNWTIESKEYWNIPGLDKDNKPVIPESSRPFG